METFYMSRHEAQIRFELIYPALEVKGWMREHIKRDGDIEKSVKWIKLVGNYSKRIRRPINRKLLTNQPKQCINTI
jgi:hypothetical protein